jgi:hypothetical protein
MGDNKEFENQRLLPNNNATSKVSARNNFRYDGEKILESKLQVSKDEDTYFANGKVFSNVNKLTNHSSEEAGNSNLRDRLQGPGADVLRYP